MAKHFGGSLQMLATAPVSKATQGNTAAPASGWVVGRTEQGPFIGEDGQPQDDISAAEVHPDEIIAKTFARRRSEMGFRGAQWKAFPLPASSETASDDVDEPYSQASADRSYKALSSS